MKEFCKIKEHFLQNHLKLVWCSEKIGKAQLSE